MIDDELEKLRRYLGDYFDKVFNEQFFRCFEAYFVEYSKCNKCRLSVYLVRDTQELVDKAKERVIKELGNVFDLKNYKDISTKNGKYVVGRVTLSYMFTEKDLRRVMTLLKLYGE